MEIRPPEKNESWLEQLNLTLDFHIYTANMNIAVNIHTHYEAEADHDSEQRRATVRYQWQGDTYYRDEPRHHSYIAKHIEEESDGGTNSQEPRELVT